MNPFRSYQTRFMQGIFAALVALFTSQHSLALAETAATNLTGISWKLVRLGTPDNLSEPISGSNGRNLTAQFYEDENIVRGTGGCNLYGGIYQINGNMLVFPDGFDQTAAGCQTEILNQQEERYFAALQGAQSYQINELGQLEISYQTNQESGVLIFEPQLSDRTR